MIIKHNELVKKAKQILLEKGFKKSQIIVEYPIKLKDGSMKILDVVGIKGKQIIGIECGGLSKDIEVIKEVVSEFIYLPYVTRKGNTFHCSNCNHSWESRVENPKACPGCKRYFVLQEKRTREKPR